MSAPLRACFAFLLGAMVCVFQPASGETSRSQSVFGADPNLSEGALALRLGDYQEGIRLTLAGLRSPAGSAHSVRTRSSAHNNLCAGYVMAGKFGEALENCNEALRLKKNNWHAYSNRAVVYVLTGSLDRAAEDIEKGKRINPDAKRLKEAEEFLQQRRAAREKKERPGKEEPRSAGNAVNLQGQSIDQPSEAG